MKNDTFSFGSFGCKRVEWCGEGVREQPLNRFRRSPSFDLPLRSDNSGSTQSFIHFLSHLRLWGYVVFDSVYLHTISFSLCVFFHSCFSFTLDFLNTTFFSLDFVYFRIYQFNRRYLHWTIRFSTQFDVIHVMMTLWLFVLLLSEALDAHMCVHLSVVRYNFYAAFAVIDVTVGAVISLALCDGLMYWRWIWWWMSSRPSRHTSVFSFLNTPSVSFLTHIHYHGYFDVALTCSLVFVYVSELVYFQQFLFTTTEYLFLSHAFCCHE